MRLILLILCHSLKIILLFNCRLFDLSTSRLSKVPSRIVALGIELSQCWRTATHRGQGQRFPGIGFSLGHDAISAVGQLVDAPQLFRTAGKSGNRHNFTVGGCSQRTLRAVDGDLEIGRAGIAADIGDRRYRPLLMGPEQVVADANIDVAGRPVF